LELKFQRDHNGSANDTSMQNGRRSVV